jgi:hypothetical protein
MLTVYLWYLSAAGWLGDGFRRHAPMRMQQLVFDESGDLTTTIAWVIGIAILSGAAYALYTNVIGPGITSATTKTNNVISQLP